MEDSCRPLRKMLDPLSQQPMGGAGPRTSLTQKTSLGRAISCEGWWLLCTGGGVPPTLVHVTLRNLSFLISQLIPQVMCCAQCCSEYRCRSVSCREYRGRPAASVWAWALPLSLSP